MKIPFQEIIYAPHSTPTYKWSEIILRSLQETHDDFGGFVEKMFFKKMIDRVFGTVYLSLPYSRIYSIFKQLKNPKIVELLCILFPANLTDIDAINAIIPSLHSRDFPESCIDYILETGIKLEINQIIVIATGGYSIVKLFKWDVTYDMLKEFLKDFITHSEVINVINSACETEMMRMYGKNINDLIVKHNIVCTDSIIVDLLGPKRSISLTYIAGIHVLMRLIGIKKLPNERFHNLGDYNASYITNKEIINMYDVKIDRDIIFSSIGQTGSPEILLMIGDNNEYNPKDDIIAILMACIMKGITHERITNVMKYLITNNYIKYDGFLVRLISTGLLNNINNTYNTTNIEGIIASVNRTYPASLLITCIENGAFPDATDIQNMFMFCDFDIIYVLLNNKITPTYDLVIRCLNKYVIYPIMISTLYDDDRVYEYLDIIENDAEIRNKNNIGYVTNNFAIKPVIKHDIQVRKVYDSLSLDDREVFIRMSDQTSIYEIMIYDITLTKEYVTYILGTHKWMDLILLIIISKKYEYILSMITYDTVLSCNSTMGRYWLVNNIINKDDNVFSKYEDLYVPHKSDRQYIIHNTSPRILIETIHRDNFKIKFKDMRKRYALIAYSKNASGQ